MTDSQLIFVFVNLSCPQFNYDSAFVILCKPHDLFTGPFICFPGNLISHPELDYDYRLVNGILLNLLKILTIECFLSLLLILLLIS